MALKAYFRQNAGQQDYTPAAAKAAGDVVKLASNRVGLVKADLAANEKGAVYIEGIVDLGSAAATVFADGDDVYWSIGTNLAVTQAAAAAGDPFAGTAIAAKVNGDTSVRVDLNRPKGTLKA